MNVFEVKDHKISQEIFHLVDCSGCGLRFTQDPPSAESIGTYYDSPRYISHSDNKVGLINYLYHRVRSIMLQKKYELIQSLSNQKSILDIGSGTGYFLNTMKKNGYETCGIEINESARKYSIDKFNLEIYTPDYLTENKIHKRFGTVTLWHVLEHIYNPKEYLSHINALILDSGYLIIAVPNYKSTDARYYASNWAGYDVPRHLWHFDFNSMRSLVESNGFNLINTKRLHFDSFYVSILSESYKRSFLSTIKGATIGLYSWIVSQLKKNKTSSIIYIFKKQSS